MVRKYSRLLIKMSKTEGKGENISKQFSASQFLESHSTKLTEICSSTCMTYLFFKYRVKIRIMIC